MPNYDKSILFRNIKEYMNINHITQISLADRLGMSQPNISKALNVNDKKSFTLAQIIDISDYFKISVDKLLGRDIEENFSLSLRSIAKMLVRLIENDDIRFIESPVEEDAYELEFDYEEMTERVAYNKKTVNYKCFYFPLYWSIPNDIPYHDQQELYYERNQVGNGSRHDKTNSFIDTFYSIFLLYKQKMLNEESYKTVIESLINNLPDYH